MPRSAILAFAALTAGAVPAQEPAPGPLQDLLRREVSCNTYTFSAQEDATVAVDGEGRLLTVWASRRQELGNYGVFAQLLDPLGRPLGTEIHVNETLQGSQLDANVAFGPDGSAWVAWTSLAPGTPKHGVFLRRLEWTDQGFQPVGAEIKVAGGPFTTCDDPALAVTEDGSIQVAWVRTTLKERVVETRRFDTAGEAGPVLRLGTVEDCTERMPDLAALPGNRVVAVWSRADENGLPLGLAGRLLEEGLPAGEEFAIEDRQDMTHLEAQVDADARGRFVVAWMATEGGGDYHVRFRRFDEAARPLGASQAVDLALQGWATAARPVVAPDGRFLITADDHAGKFHRPGEKPLVQVDVRARLFDAEGRPEGEAFVVHRPANGRHETHPGTTGRDAVWSSLGQIAFAWSGRTEADGSGVGLTLLAPADLDPPAPPEVEPLAALADLQSGDMRRGLVFPEPLPEELRAEWKGLAAGQGGNGFVAHDATIWQPPDPDLAVGPNHFVTQVNMEIAWFDKAGNEQNREENAMPGGFWQSLGAEDFVFDPTDFWDPFIGRFVIANSELASDGDYLLLGVSKTDNPNDGWWLYRIKVSPTCNFPDFPNFGMNEDAYYISTDCFSGGGNRVFIFDKSIVSNGLPMSSAPSVQMSPGFYSLGNTKNYDAGSPQYFVTSFGPNSGSGLTLRAITDPVGTPVLHEFQINTTNYSQPPDANQQGSSSRLDTVDLRIKNGIVRNGHLYAVHTIGAGSDARVRWYDIDLRGWPTSGLNPRLVNEGEVDHGPGIDTFMADIGVDASGNILIAYNRSSNNEFASVRSAWRLATDPPGVLRNATTSVTSNSAYTGGRWGDYSGVDEDPAAPGTFWFHLEAAQNGAWFTWVGQDTIDPSAPSLGEPTNPVAGQNTDISVSGATPGGNVSLAGAVQFGSAANPACGAPWGLANPRVVASAAADANGDVTWTLAIPASFSGRTVLLQAVDETTCIYTNPVIVDIQ